MQTNTHRIFPYKCMVMQSYSTSFTIPYKAGTINLVTENKTAKLLFYFGHMADHRSLVRKCPGLYFTQYANCNLYCIISIGCIYY